MAPASSHAYANPFRNPSTTNAVNRGVGTGNGHWASNYNGAHHQAAQSHSVARPSFASNTGAANHLGGANGLNHSGVAGAAGHTGLNGVHQNPGAHQGGLIGAGANHAINHPGNQRLNSAGTHPGQANGFGPHQGNLTANGLNGRQGGVGGANHLNNSGLAGNTLNHQGNFGLPGAGGANVGNRAGGGGVNHLGANGLGNHLGNGAAGGGASHYAMPHAGGLGSTAGNRGGVPHGGGWEWIRRNESSWRGWFGSATHRWQRLQRRSARGRRLCRRLSRWSGT